MGPLGRADGRVDQDGLGPAPGNRFDRSIELAEALAHIVPGGAHTYAKGPDQYPSDCPPILTRGHGSHVWDVDGNELIEYGSGLRSVILGHAHPGVTKAVAAQLPLGSNFVRPAALEFEAAQDFLAAVPTMDMVKFAKNGSDVTTAAVRLARAVTGRSKVAFCSTQPFFSTDDWFIGSTPMAAGIPRAVSALSLTFPYGDLEGLRAMLTQHEGQVAAIVLEVETATPAPAGYLEAVVETAHTAGTLVVFDEMITGLRWALGGAHSLRGVTPDLVTFGKALANGFSVSALAGQRDIMERGGLATDKERVFLLSTTHGAEASGLAAMQATLAIHRHDGVAEQLASIGTRLTALVREVVASEGLSDHLIVRGHPANLVFATLGASGEPSQIMRTVFMRQLILRGILAPSFVVNAAHSEDDLERTVDAVARACPVYRSALESDDPSPWVGGRPVKPVFRAFT